MSAGPADAASGGASRNFGSVLASVWLLFLIAPLLQILGSGLHTGLKALGCGVILGFAALYAWAFHRHGVGTQSVGPQLLVLAGLLVLATAMWPFLGEDAIAGSPYVLSYASFALAPALSRVIGPALLAVAVTLMAITSGILAWWPLLIIDVAMVVIGLVTARFVRRLQAAEDLAREQLVLTERNRLARDVHDLLGHSLTVIGLKTQLVERVMATDPDRARSELAEIRTITAEALAGVRRTVDDVRATGLASALSQASDSLAAGGVDVAVTGDPTTVPEGLDVPLAWVVREATTNVLRHAGATSVRVAVGPGQLLIDDDGRGLAAGEGNGISGMRERLEPTRARLTLSARAGAGTRVEVTW